MGDFMKKNKTYINKELLKWYDQNARVLPWRDNPTPYRVWISEIMLQQTRVEAVRSYFERWMLKAPDVFTLSELSLDEINKLWEGLGYYSRVRNILKASKIIVEQYDGIVPSSKQLLEELPGIGPYTSGAISSIAFNQKETAVDGNVLRVFSRLTANKNDIKNPSTKKEIKELVYHILPSDRVGDFNQSLMELGATVCLPNGKPKCDLCPLIGICESFIQKLTSVIPVKKKKKEKRIENITVKLIMVNNLVAINKRPNKGLLASLYEYPNVDYHMSLNDVKLLYPNSEIVQLPDSKHVFTHIVWKMKGFMIHIKTDDIIQEHIWTTQSDIINKYSIPTAFKAYSNHLLKQKEESNLIKVISN